MGDFSAVCNAGLFQWLTGSGERERALPLRRAIGQAATADCPASWEIARNQMPR